MYVKRREMSWSLESFKVENVAYRAIQVLKGKKSERNWKTAGGVMSGDVLNDLAYYATGWHWTEYSIYD